MTNEPVKIVMPSDPVPDRPSNQGPGPLRRFLRGLVRLLLVLLLIGGAIAAGYYLWQELQQASGTADARLDDQAAQLEALQAQLGAQATGVAAARETVTGLDARLAGNLDELQTAVQGSDAAQDQAMTALEDAVATLTAGAGALDENVAALRAAQATQEAQAGGLAGALAGQEATAAAVLNNLSGLATEQAAVVPTVIGFAQVLERADPEGLREAVLVFRLWQHVARARLRLVENNLGLAADDVQLSLEALALLDETRSAGQQAEALGRIAERLLEAQANLPDAPLPAANDLDLAWQELDGLLAALLEAQVAAQATPAPEGTAAVVEGTPVDATPTAVFPTKPPQPAATP